ncbi:MAG: hypothetical protein AB7F78_24390, partial [Hyphomicrobiaceae bacterium]
MQATLALLPSAVVLLAVLGLRASGIVAAAAACLAAGAVWISGTFAAPTPAHIGNAAVDASILTVLVAAMIVPGILFVEATRGRNAGDALRALVGAIDTSRPQTAMLVAVGIGVTVESLTGMGVS